MKLLSSYLRNGRVVGGLVVFVLLGAIGSLPLFGAPGYEQAIAAGLVVPSAAAIATAVRRRPFEPVETLGRGVGTALVYAAIAIVVSLLHTLRVGICDLWSPLLYFCLTAGIGSMLGGAWGAVVSTFGPERRWLRIVLALAGPIGSVCVSLYRFVSSPMVFAFDPFVGYFSGVLFDTVIDAGNALLTYRIGTFTTLVALAMGASILRTDPLRLDLTTNGNRVRGALALLATLASAGNVIAGTSLGHFSTTASIKKDLGAEKHGARCDVIYPSTTREQEAKLLLKDCEEQIRAVEARLGTKGPARITAFFFRDENDKKRLMGAAHTYIAKPWREEVYLQLGSYPHPVLGHELAHVIAGSFGRGPFKIAGSAGGWLPNPGLIEGTAVFASPDDEDITDAQWAHAMMKIGILPPMKRVFSFSFFGDSSAKSYTLAGAFIAWIAETKGTEIVRRWYGGEDIEQLTSMSWPEIEKAYREHLKTVALPDEAESFARARFTRPGLFGRRCPHAVDATRHEADVCRDTQRFDEAIRLYQTALSMDPTDFASQHSKADVMRRHTDKEAGRRALEIYSKRTDIPRNWRDRAEEALADADFIDGNLLQARGRYDALAKGTLEEDSGRTLEIKKLATEDESARDPVRTLLLGDEKHGPDAFVAAALIGEWRGGSRGEKGIVTPLGSYLIGRNLIQRGWYERGAEILDDALKSELPTPRVARETLRQRAIAGCATQDEEALTRVKAIFESPADPFKGASAGRRDAILRMIARCH